MRNVILAFLSIPIIFVCGCSHFTKPSQEENQVERMYKDYLAAWASHDVDRIVSFFTDDCIYEDLASGTVRRGREELKDFIKNILTAFPDLKVEVTSFFVAGDRVGSEWVITGTRTGPSPYLPGAKKTFAIRGASITELQGGRIKRNSNYWNMTSYLQQVGLMPDDWS